MLSLCYVWRFMAAKNEALDRVLSGLPRLRQSEPVEDAEYIRFTVELGIDPSDHHQPPEIFALFSRNEFRQASSTRDVSERFKQKIEHHSFKDAISGKIVETSAQKDSSGIWRALTVDGLRWVFDRDRDRWIKDIE